MIDNHMVMYYESVRKERCICSGCLQPIYHDEECYVDNTGKHFHNLECFIEAYEFEEEYDEE